MSEEEKQLLKRLAEAYAFISDMHNAAVITGTAWVINRTRGVEKRVEELRETYPKDFQRYFSKAVLSARKVTVKEAEEKENVKRESPPRRKAEPKEKHIVEEIGSQGSPPPRSSRRKRTAKATSVRKKKVE